MTTVGLVKDALPVLFAAALPDSQVIDGPEESVSRTKSHVLAVGDVIGQNDVSNFALTTDTEQYSVQCAISVGLPGYEVKPVRDGAIADYVAAKAAVQADPSLGIANVAAAVGSFELQEYASDKGRSAMLTFPVMIFAAS